MSFSWVSHRHLLRKDALIKCMICWQTFQKYFLLMCCNLTNGVHRYMSHQLMSALWYHIEKIFHTFYQNFFENSENVSSVTIRNVTQFKFFFFACLIVTIESYTKPDCTSLGQLVCISNKFRILLHKLCISVSGFHLLRPPWVVFNMLEGQKVSWTIRLSGNTVCDWLVWLKIVKAMA